MDLRKVLNVFGILLSAILMIPIFILESLLILNLVLNSLVSTDNLDQIMEQLMTFNNRNNEILITYADTETFGNYKLESGKINYSMFEGKIEEFLTNYGFEKEEATKIVKNKDFKDMVTNYLESVALNKIKDSEIRYPTEDEIKKFIKDNYQLFEKVKMISGKYNQKDVDEFVSENYDTVKEKLTELNNEIEIPESKEWDLLKKLININPFVIIGIIFGTIILLMILRKSFYKWLIWFSIPTFLNGLLFSAIGLFGMRLVTSLVNLDNYIEIINPIAKKMSTLMIRYGIIFSIATAVMIIIYTVVKNNLKNKKAK